ncbi:unnamed protein product [Cyprideis torosa]|uniref:Uncharacterized protein n=1 Tax=Cyprideis torosa TaxID=163714 RepID=A0A7R8WHH7_9CRUS|nr:unnamed protein product [Cyprideis torosa]CAG0899408.1 unnamed protein product [Cyprideis torosa]
MASEIQKEPSALETHSLDEVFNFAKLEDPDPHVLSGFQETVPLQDVTPGWTVSMGNNSQTWDVPDQIEVSEDDGTVRKGNNSGGDHCQKKKRFTCAVCGKSLSSKQSLKSHELTHTGEKPFACKICGKTFSKSRNLSTHILTHTGEKPFACRGEISRCKLLSWIPQAFDIVELSQLHAFFIDRLKRCV